MTEGKVLEFKKRPSKRKDLLVLVRETEEGTFVADIDDRFTIEAASPSVLGQLLSQYLAHSWKPE